MKINHILVIVAVIIFSAIILTVKEKKQEQRPQLTNGSTAPGFALKDMNGKPWQLADLKGSVVFVNFWATWCPPCKEEKPHIQRLFNKFMDNPKFQIVTILHNDTPSSARVYVKEHNYTFPVLIDEDSKTAGLYGITGVPETFLIDKNGIVRERVIGGNEWDSPETVSLITRLIAEQ